MTLLAPVALFVHARVDHTAKVINALKSSDLAHLTELHIFSDGARDDKNEEKEVKSIRELISNIDGFKNVIIIERTENWGLKKNILNGISSILDTHDNIIVLEDDIIVNKDFLIKMNKYLDDYKDIKDIWHISAWNVGVDSDCQLFKSQFMSCWGWATWSKNWNQLELNPHNIIKRMSIIDRYKFNLNGSYPFFSHIIANLLKKRNTWAIFWAATIFINKGRTITPTMSAVTNIGMDGSGSHDAIDFKQHNVEGRNRLDYIDDSKVVEKKLSAIFRNRLPAKSRVKMVVYMLMPSFIYDLLSANQKRHKE